MDSSLDHIFSLEPNINNTQNGITLWDMMDVEANINDDSLLNDVGSNVNETYFAHNFKSTVELTPLTGTSVDVSDLPANDYPQLYSIELIPSDTQHGECATVGDLECGTVDDLGEFLVYNQEPEYKQEFQSISSSTSVYKQELQSISSPSTSGYKQELQSISSSTSGYKQELQSISSPSTSGYKQELQPISSPSTGDYKQEPMSISSPSSGGKTTTKKPSKRRRNYVHKPKLYEVEEPYSDEDMERKRRNAIKAHNNRTKKDTCVKVVLGENEKLQAELKFLREQTSTYEKDIAGMKFRENLQNERVKDALNELDNLKSKLSGLLTR